MNPSNQPTQPPHPAVINEAKHFYFVELATLYGMNEAVILTNIIFWIRVNIKNNNNYKSGYYWTFNSVSSYSELFPEFTDRQIQYALDKLENCGVLVSGNFNKFKYDKTKWYRLGSKIQGYYFGCEPYFKEKPFDKFVKWILQFCQMDLTKSLNGFNEIVEPIPYINHIDNTNINSDSLKEDERQEINYSYYVDKWNEFASTHNLDKIIKLSDKRRTGIKNRLKDKDFDFDVILEKISKSDFLLGKTGHWKINFDWIFVYQNNYIKILENNYSNNDNRHRRNKLQEFKPIRTY